MTGKRFEDRITVTRSRVIGLPTQFCDLNSIKDYVYAVLYYDKTNNAIGIKFTNDPSEPGKIKITKNNKGYGAHIPATSFFKANRINTKKYAGRYEHKKVNVDEGNNQKTTVFAFNLKEKEEKM